MAARYFLFCAFLPLCIASVGAFAQSSPPLSQEQIAREQQESWEAASKVAVRGPATVPLGEQGSFTIPADIAFVPKPEAERIMRSLGNRTGPTFLGLSVSMGGADWLAVLNFQKEGYIKDDDAKDWNAADLLQNLTDGTNEANKDRLARGFPALEVKGWIEPPLYDAATHRLVWSLALARVGQNGASSVNYNTYLLGREGYYSLNFITSDKLIEQQKPVARQLLGGLSFADGKRYTDFNPVTDQVASYGLAALVGGAVLKKVGVFALVLGFFAKFAKLAAVLIFGAIALVIKLFRRKPANDTPSDSHSG